MSRVTMTTTQNQLRLLDRKSWNDHDIECGEKRSLIVNTTDTNSTSL